MQNNHSSRQYNSDKLRLRAGRTCFLSPSAKDALIIDDKHRFLSPTLYPTVQTRSQPMNEEGISVLVHDIIPPLQHSLSRGRNLNTSIYTYIPNLALGYYTPLASTHILC